MIPKSKSTERVYNGIHRQQLFHWIGRHLETPALKKYPAQRIKQREAYVECLRKALETGLWLKVPQKPDFLGDGNTVKVTRPIACFTEWSLGQSLPHTTEYGRLGFGFSKRFVLSHGGQPVTYVRDAKSNAPFGSALLALGDILKDHENGIPRNVRHDLSEHFEFISHFAKRIQVPPKPRMPALALKPKGFSGLESMGFKEAAKRHKEALAIERAFNRNYGQILHYLEEREWRIVYDKSLDHFEAGPGGAGPQHYLPFTSGKELLTVVLPDNLTVNLALRDPEIRNKLYPEDAPHVTVLSLQDIGTF
jgi:hypothetical protein